MENGFTNNMALKCDGDYQKMSNDNIVKMFWYGKTLSAYEQLSITSFLKQGHQVEVFSYEALNLPSGAMRVDAAEVLPESEVFTYPNGSVAAFADLFRYKLLYERGGIWADSDVMCLRPMDGLPTVCVGRQDDTLVNNALMRFPAGHPLAGELYEHAAKLGRNTAWGQTGPHLLTQLLSGYPDVTVLPGTAFYPVHWSEAWKLITPEENDYCASAAAESYAVHWWNEIFRLMGIPKDKLPPAESYLGRHAAAVLDDGWDAWPSGMVATWVDHFRDASLAEPVKRFFQGKSELADLMRDLGEERLNGGHWHQAAELLNVAHLVRPNGPYIRQLLAQALIGLEKREEAEALLAATKKRAEL